MGVINCVDRLSGMENLGWFGEQEGSRSRSQSEHSDLSCKVSFSAEDYSAYRRRSGLFLQVSPITG